MNRLLQHFVDSSGSQASRPPIPAPPQSSGGSYNAGNRGSYQRAAPGGPFYYQPPTHFQQRNDSGLDEIPLTSQSSGGVYETVDLNADSSQQQQRLFTPNSQTQGSRDAHRGPFYQQQAPGSTGELFASGPPPARELFGGPPSSSGSGGNPFRRQSNPMPSSGANGSAMFGHSASAKDPFAASHGNGHGAGLVGHSTPPPNDPFAASQNGGFGGQAPQHDMFAAPRSGENRDVFGGQLGASAHDPFAVQRPMDAGLQHQQGYQHQHDEPLQPTSVETSTSPFASASSNSTAPVDPFASAPSHSTPTSVDPFASTPSHSGSSSLFDSPAPSNGPHQRIASADSLFSSPAPANNGAWAQPTQPEPSPARTQNLFASEAPTASSLFGGNAPSQFEASPPAPSKSQICAPPLPVKSQVSTPPSPVNPQGGIPPPSPAKPPVNVPSSPMKPPIGAPPSPMINASSSPMRSQVTVPASPVMRPEDHLTPAFGSMKLSAPAKSPLKSGLDVRHMKFPVGKRDDDAVSNAPSMAPSRMSMLSTLDDSLKLSDMYKQMTARLEGEKHDLLKVVTSQAQEIAQMKKQIQSLELQLKKSRP